MPPARAVLLLVALLTSVAGSAQPRPSAAGDAAWPQWGGPTRDFTVPGPSLGWDGAEPARVWERELGDGFSSVIGDAATVYTAHREGDDAVVQALDAATGRPRWSRRVDSAPLPDMFLNYGQGPNSTPALAGTRLFVVTFTGRLCALEAATGEVVWSRELWRDLGGTFRDVGYSNSPLVAGDLVVVPVGGQGQALAAFRLADGTTAWTGGDLGNAMSSPVLIELDGERQIVALMVEGVAGFEPASGRQLWFHPHRTDYDVNAATPVWHPATRTLLISSAYGQGTRALRLSRTGERTDVAEAWFSRRLRVHHGNLLALGGHVYGSSGDFGPAPLTALDLATGAVAWQSRTFPKATLVQVGERTLVLDEDGRLAVVALSPSGLEVLQQAQVTSRLSWTPPTVVGRRVYVRDRRSLVALELLPRP